MKKTKRVMAGLRHDRTLGLCDRWAGWFGNARMPRFGVELEGSAVHLDLEALICVALHEVSSAE